MFACLANRFVRSKEEDGLGFVRSSVVLWISPSSLISAITGK